LTKGILSSGVHELILGCIKIGYEKSQADCLGTERRL